MPDQPGITAAPTSTTAFVGRTRRGPTDRAVAVGSYGEFERVYGGSWDGSALPASVRDFFSNGGRNAVRRPAVPPGRRRLLQGKACAGHPGTRGCRRGGVGQRARRTDRPRGRRDTCSPCRCATPPAGPRKPSTTSACRRPTHGSSPQSSRPSPGSSASARSAPSGPTPPPTWPPPVGATGSPSTTTTSSGRACRPPSAGCTCWSRRTTSTCW